MFYGTTPSIISQWLAREFSKSQAKRVFVPFAGNFVVEQIAAKVTSAEVHSTDISLYSRAIGYGITLQDSEIRLKPNMAEMFPVVGAGSSPLEIAAGVVFMTEVGQILTKQKVKYYQNLLKDAIENEEMYYEKLLEKLGRVQSLLGGMKFYGTDGCDLTGLVEEGDLVFYDPPVLLGDYEKMFAPLEECYDFETPEYTEMTDEVKEDHLFHLADIGAELYYRTNNPLQGSQEFNQRFSLVYQYQYKYDGEYCVYASQKKSTFVGMFSPLKDKAKALRLIDKEDVLPPDAECRLIQEESAVINHYRMLWTKKATMTDAGTGYLVVVDGKVIGTLTLSDGLNYGVDKCLILSDPACPYSSYKRLSKLILYICSTQETLDMFNELTMWEHVGFTTRVFTNAPVSMKYRGLFDLAEKVEDEGDYKYKLIYQNTRKIAPTWNDGYRIWYERHAGQRVHD